MSVLFNKIPDSYIGVKKAGINTFFKHKKGKKFKVNTNKGKNRDIFSYLDNSGEYQIASSVFKNPYIRIINLGKYHVDFQIESFKTGKFGMLRSAKLTDKRGKYFEWKNNKYFISKRNIVL